MRRLRTRACKAALDNSTQIKEHIPAGWGCQKVTNNHWMYQGRQYHQWFGHGTAPKQDGETGPPKPGSLFDPLSVGHRVNYVSGSVVAHSPRDERSRWEARISGANRDSLKTAVAVWYGASKLKRSAFRQGLLDPNTSDETVDRLRAAAKGIVDARSHAQLAVAGASLATAAQAIGLYRWPGFLSEAERKEVERCNGGHDPWRHERELCDRRSSRDGLWDHPGFGHFGLSVSDRSEHQAVPTNGQSHPADTGTSNAAQRGQGWSAVGNVPAGQRGSRPYAGTRRRCRV